MVEHFARDCAGTSYTSLNLTVMSALKDENYYIHLIAKELRLGEHDLPEVLEPLKERNGICGWTWFQSPCSFTLPSAPLAIGGVVW